MSKYTVEKRTSWAVPEETDARILGGPNLPLPLHGCLEPDAEVLTKNGWGKIEDVEKGEHILCWDNGKVFFDTVLDTVSNEYSYAYKIGFNKATNFDMVYSPDHRLPLYYKQRYYGGKKKKLETPKMLFFVRTAENFKPGPATYFITAAESSIDSQKGLTPKERLAIAIQADGSFKRDNLEDRTYVLSFKKKRKVERLTKILEDGGIQHTVNRFGDYTIFHIRTDKVDYKKLQNAFRLEDISYSKARQIIEELSKWDGYNGVSRFGTARKYYVSTDRDNIGFVQAVAMMAGYTTTTHMERRGTGRKDCWTVWFVDKKLRGSGKIKKELIQHSGKMYCVTVPSSFFVIRYHDVILVTGNCNPRTIMGTTAWDRMRKRGYYLSGYKCEICGADCSTPGSQDFHELYTINYMAGTSTYVRAVAICKQCVDEDTEVLTSEGWKKIPNVTTNDLVACWDDKQEITFQHPTDTIKSYHEEAIRISYRDKIELFFSPNHRLLLQVASAQSSTYKKFVVKQADKYRNTNYYHWVLGGNTVCPSNNVLTDAERIFIAIEADGCISWDKENMGPRSKNNGARERKYGNRYGHANYRYSYVVSVKKQRKIKRLLELLPKSGLEYKILGYKKDKHFQVRIWNDKNLKHFKDCFDLEMGANKARDFIEELVFWDGSSLGEQECWYTTKRDEVDFVQAVAAQCNVRTSVRVRHKEHKKTSYCVGFSYKWNYRTARVLVPEKIEWKKEMYCLTVPTSFFVARRKGFVFVTGNCHSAYHSGRLLTLYKQGAKFYSKATFLNTAEHCFKLINEWNKKHPSEKKLKAYETWLEALKREELSEKLEKLIDEYEIEFWEEDKKKLARWSDWKLIFGNREYPTRYKTRADWEKAMEEASKKDTARMPTPFSGGVFDEISSLIKEE